MRELLRELTAALDQGRDCVYCSLVETRGSTPQKAGAAMLVLADGGQRGTLGGGCVEAEVKQRALRLLGAAGAEPEVRTFQLDDNYGWDDGLICGGRMTMVLHPLTECSSYFQRYRDLVESGQGCTEVIAIGQRSGPAAGERFLFDGKERLVAQLAKFDPHDDVFVHLPPLVNRPKPSLVDGLAYLP